MHVCVHVLCVCVCACVVCVRVCMCVYMCCVCVCVCTCVCVTDVTADEGVFKQLTFSFDSLPIAFMTSTYWGQHAPQHTSTLTGDMSALSSGHSDHSYSNVLDRLFYSTGCNLTKMANNTALAK